ncbi:hypothetical protein NDU88_004317 [Pleurodeles waltl]|uniref:Uncharacterized protein n=1 Tax=Pleurodeles waltl TaxID=8319 RepID=A0AAV7RIE4_PLEWA|nr:hypothetical protein NDU88_004317 [Pleurodeles waltl]
MGRGLDGQDGVRGKPTGSDTERPAAGKYRSVRRTAEEKGLEGLVSSATVGGVPCLPRELGAPRVETAPRNAWIGCGLRAKHV